MQLKDVALGSLERESLTVDEGSVRRLDVFDEDLRGGAAQDIVRRAPGDPALGTGAAGRTLPSSLQTSACIRLSTLESKYPFEPFGIVLAFVWRPILTLVPAGASEICFGTNVSLSGVRCSAGNACDGGADWGDAAGGAGVAGVMADGGVAGA